MSAILGIWHRDGRLVESQPLHAMMEPIQYLGRERSATWLSGPVAFGHHHLAYTPESVNERLPYTHPSGRWTIVADARLDNRQELLSALGRPVSDAMPDGELLLAAYLEWSDDCVRHLLGDFVLVVWDAVTQELFCARDHMGVRPFYYHLSETTFLFASGLNGILAHPAVTRAIDEGRLAEVLVPMLNDREATCFESIRRLGPAHTMRISRTGVTKTKYWALNPDYEHPPASDEEYAEELRRIFTTAVASRVRSAFPIGATLSGGLDSSSNVVVAREMSGASYPGQLHTFSAAFTGKDYDEKDYFNDVIECGGITPHVKECVDIQPLAHMVQALRLQGELFNGVNLCIQIDLYDYMRDQSGIRGLLEGFDGDSTIYHGFERIGELSQNGRWGQAIAEARAFARYHDAPARSVVLRRVVRPAVPDFLRTLKRQMRSSNTSYINWDRVIHPQFAKRVNLEDRLQARAPIPSSRINLRARHIEKLETGFFQNVFEVLYPTALWRNFYALFPYCDVRLMEFCVALPGDQKFRNGLSRFIMHNAMTTLPERVRWRAGKTNPSPIVGDGLHKWHDGLLQSEIMNPAQGSSDYIDFAYAKTVYRRYTKHPTATDAISLWKAVMLSQWIKYGSVAA